MRARLVLLPVKQIKMVRVAHSSETGRLKIAKYSVANRLTPAIRMRMSSWCRLGTSSVYLMIASLATAPTNTDNKTVLFRKYSTEVKYTVSMISKTRGCTEFVWKVKLEYRNIFGCPFNYSILLIYSSHLLSRNTALMIKWIAAIAMQTIAGRIRPFNGTYFS